MDAVMVACIVIHTLSGEKQNNYNTTAYKVGQM